MKFIFKRRIEKEFITFEEYLKSEMLAGSIDFAIRAENWNGVRFYIHPASKGGQTVNFDVHENSLVTTAETEKPLGQEKLPS